MSYMLAIYFGAEIELIKRDVIEFDKFYNGILLRYIINTMNRVLFLVLFLK